MAARQLPTPWLTGLAGLAGLRVLPRPALAGAGLGGISLNRLWDVPGLRPAPGSPSITIRLPLPGLPDFGIVFAVPKKKTSLTKRRKRRYESTDKHVKPVQSLNECPSCGRVKRAHTVCEPCYNDIKQVWKAENGELTRPRPERPESVDEDFMRLLENKVTDIPKRGEFLKQLRKEDNSTAKVPMFEYKKLHK